MNTIQNKTVAFEDLGTRDYQSAWDYQESLMKNIIDLKIKNRDLPAEQHLATPNHFLLVEHPHVYTLGKSGHEENMLAGIDKLKEIDATFVKVNRGGDITYHGYGQIVGYPILDLENFFTDIHKYMRNLEEVIIRTIAEYGLNGERSPGETGVWLDVGKPYARKICAMGVSVPLGNPAWLCLKCKHRYAVFRIHHSVRDQRQAGHFAEKGTGKGTDSGRNGRDQSKDPEAF